MDGQVQRWLLHMGLGQGARNDRAKYSGVLWLAWLAVLGLLSWPEPGSAERFLVRTYTEQDGLLNSKVSDLAQGSDGRLWFLTRSGLTVYDGTDWEDILAPEGFSSRDFSHLALDSQGGLWVVGNEPSSLARHDGVRWNYTRSLANSYDFKGWVTSMAVLSGPGPPRVALGTNRRGLFLWDSELWQQFTEAHGLPGGAIHDVVSGGDVLYAGTEAGLFRLENEAQWSDLTALLGLPKGNVRALVLEHGEEERLWMIGDQWTGYLQDGSFKKLASEVRIPIYRPKNRLNAGLDGRGGVYFGNPSAAFHLNKMGEIRRFGKANGLLVDGATAFLLDREDNLWVSSLRGVSKVSSRRFATLDREHGLYGDEVSAILERPSGQLVFGHDAGLTLYRRNDEMRQMALSRTDLGDEYLGKQVLDLDEDNQGRLWIAAANQGLARLDPNGKLTWMLGGTGSKRVDTVRVDGQGRIWVGTRRGLFQVVEDRLEQVVESELGEVRTRRLITGKSGALYLATSSEGLFVLREDQWSHYEGEGPGTNSLFAVHEFSDGSVWVGSDVGILELREGALRRIETPELQFRRPVFFLTEDLSGQVWIGTDFGVRRWDGRELQRYTFREGLAGNSTNRAAGIVDSKGQVWIGTDRGVSRYQGTMEKSVASPLRISHLEIEVGDERVPLTEEVTLDYTANQIIFHALALTFVNENHVQYRYRLDGIDEEWVETEESTRFEGRYPIIPPGTYRFHLEARNSESDWVCVESASIVVQQPFWRQIWFYLLMAGLIGGLGYSVQHYLSQRRHSRLLEDEVRLRTAALATSEQAIAAERERLSVTLASIADGVIATDREGQVLFINQAATRLTGWPEKDALLQELNEVLPLYYEEDEQVRRLRPVQAVLEIEETLRFPLTYRFCNRDGEDLLLELDGAPVRRVAEESLGVVLVFRDVSEQKKMEDERSRTQKLEAIGVLAGGIAHDFNNILTGIMGHLSLARMIGLEKSKAQDHLGKAEKAVSRATGLARQLLTFARGGAPMTGPASIADLVSEAAPFVLSGTNVKYEIQLGEGLWPVEIDQGQISQVLSNLLINAAQAMPEGGAIRISARNFWLDESTLELRTGRYVLVSVEDHGVGIAPRHLRRVFDPYFTTKQTGSGLGLATAYSIMQKHGGAIELHSELGVGTKFSLFIPASEERPETGTLEVEDVRSFGTGKILLMDDEESVLNILKEMLEHLGYQAAVATDGAMAIDLYRESLDQSSPYDLVVLDLTVPGGMGGKEALRELLKIDPKVNAIVSSGYSEDPVMSRYREHGLRGVLAKPYRLPDVARVLRDVFAEQKGGAAN